MKLRFRKNSIRLRVNQAEVEGLAAGAILQEQVHFPRDARIAYILESSPAASPDVSFLNGVIHVSAPQDQVRAWAFSDTIGLYFELPGNGNPLSVAIEKDLVCLDAPSEEQEPHAFPRSTSKNC